MRGKAYRRAQQKRMIRKARKVFDTDAWYGNRLINGEWVQFVYDPHVEAKKLANNMAYSESWNGSFWGSAKDDLPRSKLRHDVSTRQQMEEYYATSNS